MPLQKSLIPTQDENTNSSDSQWRQKAVEEFDTALATLRENSIKVTVFQVRSLLIIADICSFLFSGHALPRETWRSVPQQLDLSSPLRGGHPLPHGHAKQVRSGLWLVSADDIWRPLIGQETGAETRPHPVAEGQLWGSQSHWPDAVWGRGEVPGGNRVHCVWLSR